MLEQDADERVTCRACAYGSAWSCPNVAPLPFAVPHRCRHHEPAAKPHRHPAGHNEPGGLERPRARQRDWLRVLATTRENDQQRGGPAMRCPDGVARHPDGSRPGEPPTDSSTT